MARVVRVSDFRKLQMPVVIWPEPVTGKGDDGGLKMEDGGNPAARDGAAFYMGQVAAVVGLVRTNRLNYRAAVKQIERIVHNYQGKTK